MERKTRKAKNTRKNVKRSRIIGNLFFLVITIILVIFVVDMFRHYEKYDSVARYQLMLDLERGDEKAKEYYQDNYINDDLYLFDGDISFDMFADKYNIIDKDNVYQEYKNSGLTLNQFVKEYKEGL